MALDRDLIAERQDLRYWQRAFLVGVLGALAMSVLMAIGVPMHRSPLSFEMMLGSLVTQETGVSIWLFGFGWHLLNGGFFGLIYAAIFKLIGKAGIGWGAFLAVFHWLCASVIISYIHGDHPFGPDPYSDSGTAPRVAMDGMSYLGALALHLVYGVIVGKGTAIRLRRTQISEERSEESFLRPTG